ncbi:hypothetical protein N7495_004988 [Penicillium taxi]|uniref:uncharacterized protein n=1 Tax=Penicillium taxi TaxID=168475 RepID=UPI0025454A42|nr:uncharacterized protein N7495_004988 [Penicillium taxi]KAJ5893297.1 hypothetical protein N7495_004988 [Penicillium taxi]
MILEYFCQVAQCRFMGQIIPETLDQYPRHIDMGTLHPDTPIAPLPYGKKLVCALQDTTLISLHNSRNTKHERDNTTNSENLGNG